MCCPLSRFPIPRRQRLLDQLGVRFKPLAVEIDETWNSLEPVRDYVVRLAIEKARAGWRKISETEPLPVLGADTVVVLDDAILGKPSHRDEGRAMLARLSGRCHHVYTAMAMIVPPGDKQQLRVNLSRSIFDP